jgi:hypothetical protein
MKSFTGLRNEWDDISPYSNVMTSEICVKGRRHWVTEVKGEHGG